jgi:hypothetical protein
MPRLAAFALFFAAALVPSAVSAQSAWQPPPGAPPPMPSQVLSANPYGLMLELFNSEYEIRASDSITFGAGASTATVTTYDYSAPRTGDPYNWTPTEREERYVNGDGFVRYYPGGRAFNGFSFGLKAGFTRIPNQGSYFGLGFDANRSLMLNDHMYLGVGGGLKRLLGADKDAFDLTFIPTLRLNVGIGF